MAQTLISIQDLKRRFNLRKQSRYQRTTFFGVTPHCILPVSPEGFRDRFNTLVSVSLWHWLKGALGP